MTWVLIGCGVFAAFWLFLLIKGTWFISKWPQWARLSSMGAIAVMMFAMIWYLNADAEKKELVWATGDAEVTWEKVPIKVAHHPEVRRDVVESALKMWNGDCALFVLVEPEDEWDVLVARGSYGEKSPVSGNDLAGSTWKKHDRYFVKIHEPNNITAEMLIVAHELSHVLGLAHDNDPRFITTPGAQSRDDLSKFLPHPSRKDEAALKQRYCD
jgi:hypothetical protein